MEIENTKLNNELNQKKNNIIIEEENKNIKFYSTYESFIEKLSTWKVP